MASETGQISVIVVNWNRREMLEGCLRSLLAQTLTPLEILVVDNGSADGSAEAAERFARVRVIKNRENRGFCAANNQGIALAAGEFVALLNNDAEADPRWLEAMRDAIGEGYGMVACKVLDYDDPQRIDKAGHLIYLDGQNRGRGTGEVDRGQYDRVEEVLWPDGCAALYRKSMLDRIGGFDEDLFAYGDDAELGLRARIAGFRCIYTPDAVVRHRRGSTLGRTSSRRITLIERNRILLAVRHFPARLLWRNPLYFAARVAYGAWAGVRGRGESGGFATPAEKLRLAGALLRGMVEGVAAIPATLRKRQSGQGLRRLSEAEIEVLLRRHQISLRVLSEGAS